jgi:hypothetical protein
LPGILKKIEEIKKTIGDKEKWYNKKKPMI